MAVTPKLITVTCTTSNTAYAVTANTAIKPIAVYFEPLDTNTGTIKVGLSSMTTTAYSAKLVAPSATSVPSWSMNGAESGRVGATGIQLSNVYVMSSVSGEKVQVTYLEETGG